jgi:predicted DNA-binding protein (UPF0251 family)
MTDVELFLLDYWHARRSVGRLMLELSSARRAYEEKARDVTVTGGFVRAGGRQRGKRSPVLLVDQLGAEVKSIERRLAEERAAMARVEKAAAQAGLKTREAEYVRLRYFENQSVETAAQRLFCSVSTCGRLRRAALKKIGGVWRAAWHEAAKEA